MAYDDYPSREFVAPWDNELVVEVNVGPPKCYVLLPKRDHDLILLQTTSATAYRRAVILAARVTSHVGFMKLLGKE